MIRQFALILLMMACVKGQDDLTCVDLPHDKSLPHNRLIVRCCPNETQYLVDERVVSVTRVVEARCALQLASHQLTTPAPSNTVGLVFGFLGTYVAGVICGAVCLRGFQLYRLHRALRPAQGFPLHRRSIWRAQRRACHARMGRPASPLPARSTVPVTPLTSTVFGSNGLVSVVPLSDLLAPSTDAPLTAGRGVVRHSLRTLLSLDDATVYEHGPDGLETNYACDVFDATNPFATVRLVVDEPLYDSVEEGLRPTIAPPVCPPPSPAEETLGAVGGDAGFVNIVL